MRISDWSSACALPISDALAARGVAVFVHEWRGNGSSALRPDRDHDWGYRELLTADLPASERAIDGLLPDLPRVIGGHSLGGQLACCRLALDPQAASAVWLVASGAPYWRAFPPRSEEHTSELQSLMRISYAVFCLKKKKKQQHKHKHITQKHEDNQLT